MPRFRSGACLAGSGGKILLPAAVAPLLAAHVGREITLGLRPEHFRLGGLPASPTLVLEVGYQGSKGTHLPLLYNINQPPPGLGTVAQKQALRPYPQWGNITYNTSRGDSSFNGLVMRLEQRYHNGLSFLVSYLYGKSIDDSPGTVLELLGPRLHVHHQIAVRLADAHHRGGGEHVEHELRGRAGLKSRRAGNDFRPHAGGNRNFI